MSLCIAPSWENTHSQGSKSSAMAEKIEYFNNWKKHKLRYQNNFFKNQNNLNLVTTYTCVLTGKCK